MALAFAVFGVAAGAVSLVENSTYAAVLAVGLVMTGVEVYLLTKMAGGLSIAILPVLTVSGTFLAAPLWGAVEQNAIVAYYRFSTSEDINVQIAIIGATFTAAYTVGALIAGARRLGLSFAKFRAAAPVSIPDGVLISVGYAAIFLAIFGFQDTLLQGRYLESRGPAWAVVLSTAGIPLAVLAFSMIAAKPGPWRGLAIIGIIVLLLISFARAGRVLALLPALILFGWTFASGQKIQARSAALTATATIFLLPLPLAGRINADGIGILPLGAQLFARPDEILSTFDLGGLAGNILVSGPLASTVADRPIAPEAFWISVNPMPGGLAGWSEIKDSLRLTPYTPYNTLGELAAHGWLALVSFAFVSGLILAYATRVASGLRGTYQLLATILILAIAVRFSLTILQYNLRSSARLLWWTVFGLAVIWTTASISSNRNSHDTPAHQANR